jgi:hypothetical protein
LAGFDQRIGVRNKIQVFDKEFSDARLGQLEKLEFAGVNVHFGRKR